jgi:hypothetical protein
MGDADSVVLAGGEGGVHHFRGGGLAEFALENVGGNAVARGNLVPFVAEGAHGKNGGSLGGAGTHGAFHQARTGGSGEQDFLFRQQNAAQIVGNAALQGGSRLGSVPHHRAAHGGKYFRCYFSGSGNE